METDERDLLEVLKVELKFLEDGGYGRSPKTPWRPLYIFEDSPTCMNYNVRENRAPCGNCVLMHLVPSEMRSAKILCRHIPLNASVDTLDSLYRYSDQAEIEERAAEWLRAAIQQVEQGQVDARRVRNSEASSGRETIKGTPLYRSLHPKCANPACPKAFHWTGGGKFFRFRPDPASTGENGSTDHAPSGIHGVRHYWLCERCSHVFTLVNDKECGVTLKVIWPELVPGEAHNELSAA
jgi:hypothetical protein